MIYKHAGDHAQKRFSPRDDVPGIRGPEESNGELSESGASEGVDVKNLDSKSFGA